MGQTCSRSRFPACSCMLLDTAVVLSLSFLQDSLSDFFLLFYPFLLVVHVAVAWICIAFRPETSVSQW